MRYVYRCPSCGKEDEHKHSIAECDTVEVYCRTCYDKGGGNVRCQRVPQPFRWGNSAWDILADRFDKGFRDYKVKQSRKPKPPSPRDYENLGGEVVEMKR